MNVSIIVPIYKGNKYVDRIITMIKCNKEYIKNGKEDINLELIFVNDFPDIPLTAQGLGESHDFDIKVVNNEKNLGIHRARINGLIHSSGDYILMLDQDDIIYDNCISSQCTTIGMADIVVGNGYKMFGERKREIYRSDRKHKLSTNEKIYLYAANQIVSPGHCLIKKSAIPREWYQYVVEDNGGDDLFLWLLMFAHMCKFVINRKCVYMHVDTGTNLSLDLKKMYCSSDKVIELCKKCGVVDEKKIRIYERRIKYLRLMQSPSTVDKVLGCIRNIDICFYKLYAYYR